MRIKHRLYEPDRDFATVHAFLRRLYRPEAPSAAWFAPIWEYAVTHAWFDDSSADRIGLWFDGQRLVGLATYELRLGEAFLNLALGYDHLQPALLDHAERNLGAVDAAGARTLTIFAYEGDAALTVELARRGYRHTPAADRPMARFAIPDPFPAPPLPEGARLLSLADDNDLVRLDRLLHRGFNHPGEPPAEGVAGRARMQSGPHFRHDLAIVAVAPDGTWASFAGLWLEAEAGYAYVEPVATDPAFRRQGYGRAAVLEGIRRCGELGATVAYVGTLKPFYQSFGFHGVDTQRAWRREWPS